jgi:hypothetical protein
MSKPDIPRRAARTGAPPANRRQVDRHPCHLKAQWRCLGSEEDNLHTAEVQDISHHGVGLIVNDRLERGNVLHVTLQGVPERLARPFLVRVRRVRAHPGGSWMIGCTWVTKLDREALQALRESARPPQPGRGELSSAPSPGSRLVNRRSSPRRQGASVAVLIFRPNDPSEKIAGCVLGRSLGGLSLSTSRPFLAGTVLQLYPTHASPGLCCVRVRVKHCSPLGKEWRLGCQFMGTATSEDLLLFG